MKHKICYIAYPNSIHTYRFISFFAKKGYETHLIAVNSINSDFEELYKKLNNFYIHRIYSTKMKIIRFFFEIYRIREILKKIKPDILHALYVKHYGWVASFLGFSPFFVTVMGSDVHPRRNKNFLSKIFNSYVLNKADIITSNSIELINLCCPNVKIKKKMHIIRSCGDLKKFKLMRISVLSDFRPKLNISEKDYVILSSRGMKKIYNNILLIKSIPYIIKKIENFVVIMIIGNMYDKKYFKKVLNLAKRHRIMDKLRFMNKIDYNDMPKLYNLSDVVLSIPNSDGIPTTMFEAMACGVPVIFNNLQIYNELIVDKKNGLIVDCREPKKLADAIIQILTNKRLASRIVKNGFKTAQEHGDFDKEMNSLNKVYKKFLR